jgi:hypothetical protein
MRSQPTNKEDVRSAGRRARDNGRPERRQGEQPGVAASMVDALEDILKWERASERHIRVEPSSPSIVS